MTFLSMDYWTIKNATWDALSDGASEHFVMDRLTELKSACARISAELTGMEWDAWFRVAQNCEALRDGINGATCVRFHPSTKFAKERMARKARRVFHGKAP